MKGISAIVATVIMLLITITLAGVAYTFIQGTFTSSTQGIDVDDAYCSGSTVTVVLRNIGTNNVTRVTCSQTAPASDTTCDFGIMTPEIGPGATKTVTDVCGANGTARSCIYRIVPPSGKSVTANAYCTG